MYDCLCVYFGDVPKAFTDSTKTSRSPSSTLSFSTKSATLRAAPYLTVLAYIFEEFDLVDAQYTI